MFTIKVITPETNHPNEGKILSALVSNYNCTIHIRKPSFSLEAYKRFLQENNQLVAHFVLHEHHSLAKEFPVKGIHLKEKDRIDPAYPYANVKIISTSIHSAADAQKLTHPFEYAFYSPLFKSISKENYGFDNSEEQLRSTLLELKKRTSIPIIGLGGSNEENIALVQKCGFDGAGVIGSVWQRENQINSFDDMMKKII